MKNKFLKIAALAFFSFVLFSINFSDFKLETASAAMSNATCGFSGKTVGSYLQAGDVITTFQVSQNYTPAFFVTLEFPSGTTITSGNVSNSDITFVQNGGETVNSSDNVIVEGRKIYLQINPFTLYTGGTITMKMSASAGGNEIRLPTVATTSGIFTPSFYDGSQTISNVVLAPGAASEIRMETAADGSGSVVSDQTIEERVGSLTVYPNSRDSYGNFIANVAADSWSLDSKTGSIVDGDLTVAGNSKSATLGTSHLGTTKIKAVKDSFTGTTGTISIVKYFAGGSGTEADPYEISNCEELQNMNIHLEAYYKLTGDIDCSMTNPDDAEFDSEGTWGDEYGFEPIGSCSMGEGSCFYDDFFTGSLNGDGHVISGLYINRYIEGLDDYDAALFAGIDNGEAEYEVYNLGLENVNISGGEYSAALAAYVGYGSINRVYSTGNVEGTYGAGGLVGRISGTISESYSEANVSAEAVDIGGLVGTNYGEINNSYSSGNVVGTSGGYCGGLVGTNNDTISNSYSTSNVSGLCETAGGFVGLDDGDVLENSFSAGSVASSYEGVNVGGLIGFGIADYDYSSNWWFNDLEDGMGGDPGDEEPSKANSAADFQGNHASSPLNLWNFTSTWHERTGDYPVFLWQNTSDDEEENDNDNSSSDPQSAYIKSWSASLYTDNNKSCSERLKLTIKGKHFDKDIKVFIGGHEASSVDRKSSKELTAKFCLEKLLSDKTDHKRKITVQNPDTEEREADKQIDLNNLENKNTNTNNTNNDYFSMKTNEGVKHIQTVLNKLGYLDQENITGTYGSITTEAIKKFQSDNNIEPTGFVGDQTKAKLKEKM